MNATPTPEGPVIRRATAQDAEAVTRIFEGPAVIRGTLQIPFPSIETWRRRLGDGPGAGIYSLLACVSGEPVGILGLHTFPDEPRLRHGGTLGMAVRDDWQRRGIGKSLVCAALDLSDRWLGLVRVELKVFTDNAPAIALYRSFGFEAEGTLRQCALRDGRLEDVLVMARLVPTPAA